MKKFLKMILNWDNFFTFLLVLFFGFFVFILYVDKNYRPFFIFILFSAVIFSIIFYLVKKFMYINTKKYFKYILLGVFVFVYSVIICGVSNIIREISDENTYVATTKDINKAEEIQKENKNIKIIKNTYNGSFWLKLRYNYPYTDYLIINLADKYSHDDSVTILANIMESKNEKTLKRRYEKRLNELINRIYGVNKAEGKANVIVQKSGDIIIDNVEVKVDIYAGYDSERIKHIINKIISDIPNKNINITTVVDDPFRVYLRYRDRLADLFENNDIKRAEELLKEAKPQLDDDYYDMLKKYYSRLIENEKRTKQKEELEKRIAKEPNNYKLYIEKGDSTYGLNAVIYYEKAIQLNPKIKDKLFKRIEYKILTESIPYLKEDDLWFNTSIKYYEKAMEKSKYKDVWNLKMADAYYYHIKDYKKALEYYNKIQDKNYVYNYKIESPYEKDNIESLPELPPPVRDYHNNPFWVLIPISPQPFKFYFSWEMYKSFKNKDIKYAKWDNSDFLYRIYYSQKQTGLYEDALSTCKKAVEKAEKNNENPAYIYDSIIKLDLKMKKFRQAKKDSQKGSSLWKQLH